MEPFSPAMPCQLGCSFIYDLVDVVLLNEGESASRRTFCSIRTVGEMPPGPLTSSL